MRARQRREHGTDSLPDGGLRAGAGAEQTRTSADIRDRPVVTVRPGDKMAEAAATMRERRVGAVVAVDGLAPVGILTERDLVRFTAAGADASTATVSEWMTSSPDTVARDVSVIGAFNSLSGHGYRHIPVGVGAEIGGSVAGGERRSIARI